MRPTRSAGAGRAATLALVALTGSACSLTEVEITPAEDVVIVEALLRIDQVLGGNRLDVLLHRTIQGEQGLNQPVPGATVSISSGEAFHTLRESDLESCVAVTPVEGTGSCYSVDPFSSGSVSEFFEPGRVVRLNVETAQGERMTSTTVIPGDFAIQNAPNGEWCGIPPLSPLELTWTTAAGAWAYVNEMSATGLPNTYDSLGIEVDDPLDLLGLSVSASDTTIVLPGEFGLFDRADLDQDLAVELQKGLPARSQAEVTITAVDRNYVNWVRGGNFNPSGQVRVPSVVGDGSGWFGAGVVRRIRVLTAGTANQCMVFESGDGAG